MAVRIIQPRKSVSQRFTIPQAIFPHLRRENRREVDLHANYGTLRLILKHRQRSGRRHTHLRSIICKRNLHLQTLRTTPILRTIQGRTLRQLLPLLRHPAHRQRILPRVPPRTATRTRPHHPRPGTAAHRIPTLHPTPRTHLPLMVPPPQRTGIPRRPGSNHPPHPPIKPIKPIYPFTL